MFGDRERGRPARRVRTPALYGLRAQDGSPGARSRYDPESTQELKSPCVTAPRIAQSPIGVGAWSDRNATPCGVPASIENKSCGRLKAVLVSRFTSPLKGLSAKSPDATRAEVPVGRPLPGRDPSRNGSSCGSVIAPGRASLNTLRLSCRRRHAVSLCSSSVPLASVPVVPTVLPTPAASTCGGSSDPALRASAIEDTAGAVPLTCTRRPRAGT